MCILAALVVSARNPDYVLTSTLFTRPRLVSRTISTIVGLGINTLQESVPTNYHIRIKILSTWEHLVCDLFGMGTSITSWKQRMGRRPVWFVAFSFQYSSGTTTTVSGGLQLASRLPCIIICTERHRSVCSVSVPFPSTYYSARLYGCRNGSRGNFWKMSLRDQVHHIAMPYWQSLVFRASPPQPSPGGERSATCWSVQHLAWCTQPTPALWPAPQKSGMEDESRPKSSWETSWWKSTIISELLADVGTTYTWQRKHWRQSLLPHGR